MQKKIIIAIIINVIILSAGLGIIGHLTINQSIDRSLHSRLENHGNLLSNPYVSKMDIAMPKLGGLEEALVEIKKINPDAKVLVLTQYEDKEYIKRFLKAGASGYMLKRAVGLDLLNAIKAISSGEAYLHPSIAASVIDEYVGGNKNEASEDLYETLTDRGKQVLKLIAEGHTSKEIADILGISAKTAVAHQTNLSEKLDIHSRAGLIKFAITKGLIKL